MNLYVILDGARWSPVSYPAEDALEALADYYRERCARGSILLTGDECVEVRHLRPGDFALFDLRIGNPSLLAELLAIKDPRFTGKPLDQGFELTYTPAEPPPHE